MCPTRWAVVVDDSFVSLFLCFGDSIDMLCGGYSAFLFPPFSRVKLGVPCWASGLVFFFPIPVIFSMGVHSSPFRPPAPGFVPPLCGPPAPAPLLVFLLAGIFAGLGPPPSLRVGLTFSGGCLVGVQGFPCRFYLLSSSCSRS